VRALFRDSGAHGGTPLYKSGHDPNFSLLDNVISWMVSKYLLWEGILPET
jgi:hypothetical protein